MSFVLSLFHFFVPAPIGPPNSNYSIARDTLHRFFLDSIANCIENVVMCVLLFFLAVPLARLIRSSLSHAWGSTTPEAADKASLIEPLMAVLFRALAVSLILGAFCGTLRSFVARSMDYWSFMASHAHAAGASWQVWTVMVASTTLTNFLVGFSIPIILFFFSLRLADMLSTGLARALLPKPVLSVNPV
jgi:hypothetical protein